MNSRISNRTSIGNTNNPALKVVSLVSAFEIKEQTNFMRDDKKYSSKKGLMANKQEEKSNNSTEYCL